MTSRAVNLPPPVDTMPCGYVSFRDDGTIVSANSTLAGWLGEAGDALVGRKFESILSVPGRIFLQTHFFPLLALHGQADEVFLTLRGAPDAVPVIASARRRETPDGALNECVFLTVRARRKYEDELLAAKRSAEEALRNQDEVRAAQADLEAHARELERHLREAQRRNEDLERVNQILSHDLREPVRKIRLFSELAHLPAHDSDDLPGNSLRKIEKTAAQVDVLLGAMRTYLAEEPDAPVEEVDLSGAVRNAAERVSKGMQFADWDLLCDPLPRVEGRGAQLELLFAHLFENAVKFRDAGRRLVVAVKGHTVQENVFQALKDRYEYADFVRLEVSDNGRGFDPKYRNYVFRLLKKVDLQSPGLGVGLALCRKIATAHSGSIDVDSTPGLGTTFTLLLPLRQL